eukprot:791901-Pelagomonas_calceolata.AAC.1
MASAYRIRQFVREHALGGQAACTALVWGTEYVKEGQKFSSELQVRHMSFEGHIGCEACNH